MEKVANEVNSFILAFLTELRPTSQVTVLTHPLLQVLTYRTGSMDNGAGATAGGGAGAGTQRGVFLRVLAVWARFLYFLLALQLINSYLTGIPQCRVCQRIHVCQNPRIICMAD